MKFVGLMSGTSVDGIDAVLLELEPVDRGGRTHLRWRVEAFRTVPFSPADRERILAALEGGTPRELALLHRDLGELSAAAVLALLEETGVDPGAVTAVGSHGQTVWHEPPSDAGRGVSLQLGCAATIAERTGIPVVSDFRSRDVAAGGEGAPLVPFADRLLFSLPGRARAIQNLGGMANVTWLPPAESTEALLAFDTGPGVVLLDAAASLATGGEAAFDRDGALAARGRVDEALLQRLLDHPFFRRPPPRSTGRETFGRALVRDLSRGLEPGRPGEGWPDLLATLVALTARSVGEAYRRWVLPRGVDEVVLTGGGARNPVLVEALRQELDPLPVRGGEALGMDPDAREAAAFAVLAWAHLAGRPGNEPAATGAAGPRVLGSLTPGAGARREPGGPEARGAAP